MQIHINMFYALIIFIVIVVLIFAAVILYVIFFYIIFDLANFWLQLITNEKTRKYDVDQRWAFLQPTHNGFTGKKIGCKSATEFNSVVKMPTYVT